MSESTSASCRLRSVDYPQSVECAVKLMALFADYRLDDLAAAVFALGSWHQNRSIQGYLMAMNNALVSLQLSGGKRIRTYDQLAAFFDTLQKCCEVSPFEDYVIPFMGHARIPFNGRWWGACFGCGATKEYPRLCFADEVCKRANRVKEFESLLQYEEAMAEALQSGGWQSGDPEKIGLYLPSAEHWERVRKWVAGDSVDKLDRSLIQQLGEESGLIERAHFFKREGCVIPLFNPSMLGDYQRICYQNLTDEERLGVVDAALIGQLRESFASKGGEGGGYVLYPCFRVDGKMLDNCPASFLLFEGVRSATLFYNRSIDEGNLASLKELFSGRRRRVEIVEGAKTERGRRVLRLADQTKVMLSAVSFVDDASLGEGLNLITEPGAADRVCSATDLMAMLQMATSIEEIGAYFRYLRTTKHEIMAVISSLSDNFVMWRESGRTVVHGSEDMGVPLTIWCDFNETDDYYRRLFAGELSDFPFVGGLYPLGSPHARSFTYDARGFLVVKRKADGGQLGVTRRLKGESDCYLVLRAAQPDPSRWTDEALDVETHVYGLLRDMFELMVCELDSAFARLAARLGGILCIEYVPRCGWGIERMRVIDDSVGLIGVVAEDSACTVRYSLDAELFLRKLMEANDRSVECSIIAGVLSLCDSGDGPESCELISQINKLRLGKKTVDSTQITLPYSWDFNYLGDVESDVSRAHAQKAVANAAWEAGVRPGEYYGRGANDALRRLQVKLTATLRAELGKYEQKRLVVWLYEVLAESSHEFFLHTKRFGAFGQLAVDERTGFEASTIDLRDEARYHMRASQYCIETVLSFGLGGSEVFEMVELSNMVSLAGQILSLSDSADILCFQPQGFGVRVEDNHETVLIEDEEREGGSQLLKLRQLLDPGHHGGAGTKDESYIKKAKVAFEQDAGFSFECFMSVIDLFALGVDEGECDCHRVRNVLIVKESTLAEFVREKLGDLFDHGSLDACLDSLTIDPNGLRTINDEELDYLPFGRKKDRPNRLELRPIVALGDEMVFSPVAMGLLERRWVQGIAERFLPVKKTFNRLCGVMTQWKRRYEKALESDAKECFIIAGFNPKFVFKSLNLSKKGNHPQYLGDYDVFAYDDCRETIWLVECKEFEKVETAYDYMQLQERWFGEKGKLKKFERRIAYVKSNVGGVLSDLGIGYGHMPAIKSLLVSNKPFENIVGESSFEIVTISELGKLLEDAKI